jgi:hypothetical protein
MRSAGANMLPASGSYTFTSHDPGLVCVCNEGPPYVDYYLIERVEAGSLPRDGVASSLMIRAMKRPSIAGNWKAREGQQEGGEMRVRLHGAAILSKSPQVPDEFARRAMPEVMPAFSSEGRHSPRT